MPPENNIPFPTSEKPQVPNMPEDLKKLAETSYNKLLDLHEESIQTVLETLAAFNVPEASQQSELISHFRRASSISINHDMYQFFTYELPARWAQKEMGNAPAPGQ